MVFKHLGLPLLADGASAVLNGCTVCFLSGKLLFVRSISFSTKFDDLMRDNRHVNRLVALLSAVVKDALEDLVFLYRRVPFVLPECLGKAVFAFGEGRALALLLPQFFGLLPPLVLVDVRMGSPKHFVDLDVRRVANHGAEALTLVEFVAGWDCLVGWRARVAPIELVIQVWGVLRQALVVLLAVLLENRVEAGLYD